jgi:hypothetical protein
MSADPQLQGPIANTEIFMAPGSWWPRCSRTGNSARAAALRHRLRDRPGARRRHGIQAGGRRQCAAPARLVLVARAAR